MHMKLTALGIFLYATFAYGAQHWVGVGIADITGPAAEVNLMGYAEMKQTSSGILMRCFARAFVFADGPASKNRFVFVSGDMHAGSQLVKLDVLKELQATYGDLYTVKNVILSGTHTHSTPAGFYQYFLYEVTSLGFVKESHDQLIRGIVESIKQAHNNLKQANLFLKTGQLQNSQINRSPTSYLQNPAEERAMYTSDTDFDMHLVRIEDADGKPMGMINWYPVHGVSMNNTNRLISGDNKGYAEQLFERAMEPGALAGRNTFVAAFAQAFEGDVSPNTAGPRCIDTGLPCDPEHSSCNGKPNNCIAFGPGRDMFESTKIIGENQFKKAMELFEAATDTSIEGDIRVVHKYVDMSNVTVDLGNGATAKTCIPALGYAFAAGATDGPSTLPFTQQRNTGNPFWDAVRNLVKPPTKEMIQCHKPKPILLTTGLMDVPYPWTPKIVDIQIAKIGQLVIVAVPGEFTTMAGRRLIAAVKKIFADAGQAVQVVVAGLSNTYAQYITTPEEYAHQRYEGASTTFGPNTLPAYIQLYKEVAQALVSGTPVPDGPRPPYFKNKLWSMLPSATLDGTGPKKFGSVLKAPKLSYRPGDVASVSFVGTNPRNSMGTSLKTFMTVDKLSTTGETAGPATIIVNVDRFGRSLFKLPRRKTTPAPKTDTWKTVFTDAEWETRFTWKRESIMSGTSRVVLEWEIPSNTPEGTYRICYFGHSKTFNGIKPISGCSPNFAVVRGR